MKKSLFVVIAACAAALLTVSCNKEEAAIDDVKTGGAVIITANMPENVTKVAGSYDGSKLALTWEETDAITVKNAADESKSVVFNYVSGAGTKTAKFAAADASALDGASSYIVSYSGLPGSLASQTQSVDGNTDHVKYSVALNGVDSYNDVSFTPAWASAHGGSITQSGALHLHATLPAGVAEVVNSVDIKAGALNVNITLSSQADAGSDAALDVFATLPAFNLGIAAGTELFVRFGTTDPDHSVYTRYYELPSALTLQTGKLNLINLTCTNTDKYAGKDDDGSSSHPYLIADKYQLAAISNELSTAETKFFKLVDDITVTGWTRIDCNAKGAIELNGNNKTISGLNDALFEYLDGKVENLNIDNAIISTTSSYYGILVRSISKPGCVISKVNVSNSSLSGGAHLGGLVGYIGASSCEVSECSTDVAVSGNAYNYGGLVGYAINGTFTITGCSATGNVESTRGSNYTFVGGLIGLLENSSCSITKCNYSTGTVSSNAPTWPECGGLIGDFKNGSLLTIEKSYFDGTVHGAQGTGGLIGQIEGSPTVTIRDCYVSGSINGTGNYAGGFLGFISATATINVINGYSNASVAGGKWSACVFAGGNAAKDYSKLTCTSVVGWNTSNRVAWCYNVSNAPTGNYMGTEGSVYSQAVVLGGWDFENVWTTDAEPKLR